MTKKVKVTPDTVYVSGGKGPKKTPVDRSEVYVKRGSAAISGTGSKRGKGGGRGKWWNPPSDPATVKDLDEIKKIEKELNEDSKKKKPRSDARVKVGGGSPSSSLVRGLLKTPRR